MNNNYEIIDNGLYEDYDYLYDVLDAALKHEKVKNAIFSVVFMEDEEIHKMNKEYRGVDRVTDVISFAFEDNNDLVYNDIRMLGDIFICIPQMKRQASEYGHSEKRELAFLAVHGILHLLGYDHMNEEDEKEMFSLQEKILGERLTMENEKLVELAIDARKRSYSPYSHFAVGAALLTKSGKTYIGANIENSSYPLCMCAERNAIYGAYLDGVKKEEIVALAIAADTDTPCSPCGACRQVISELLPKNAKILMANLKNEIKETTIAELLPFAFSEDDLK